MTIDNKLQHATIEREFPWKLNGMQKKKEKEGSAKSSMFGVPSVAATSSRLSKCPFKTKI